MVDNISKMFITGPQVVEAVTGESISADELGGAVTHNEISGVAHFLSESEDSCFDSIRRLLSFLPQNNMEDTILYDSLSLIHILLCRDLVAPLVWPYCCP